MTGRPTRRSVTANDKLVLALPKGRILKAITPLLTRAGIEPEDAFFDEDSRQLQFATRDPQLDIIRVRSFDRSEEHTSELQSLMRISYAVFCLKKKTTKQNTHTYKS